MRNLTCRFLKAAALLATLAVAPILHAQTAMHFTLPAQPLADALRAVGTQTNTSVVFDASLVEGRKAPAIDAQMSLDQALSKLLAGTGITHQFINERTVVLAAAGAKKTAAEPTPAAGLRLARADVAETAQAAPQTTSSKEDTAQSSEAGTPEILVKGRRTVNTDIKRTVDDAQPYVVFTREEIQRSMATNLEDFFKNRLPMNTTQTTNSQRNGNVFGSQSEINLRGLGAKQTLILVDGRRLAGVNTGGTDFGQPDINGIPLASIERIEVLPSTASGIYGGGATGGAINIITRQDFSGLDVNLSYENTFDSDVAGKRVDISGGFNLEGGRTQVLVSASHSEYNPLFTGERDFAARGRALQFRNNPSVFFTGNPPVGYTTNIRSQNINQPLVLKAAYGGQSLNSPRTYVPLGYAGINIDGGAPLLANAGQYNLDLPNDSSGLLQSGRSNPQVQSATLNIRRSFGERVQAFVDLSERENHSRMFGGGTTSSATLLASAPNNPFTNNIVVRFPDVGLRAPSTSDSDSTRITAGLIVRLGHDWTASADYGWNRSNLIFRQASTLVGNPDGIHSVTADLNSGLLDVMRDLNETPIDFSPYMLPQPTYTFGPAKTIMNQPTLRVSGPLWRMPAGPVVLSALAEQRKMHTLDTFDDFNIPNSLVTADYMAAASQNVESYYVETRVPLFSAANGRPFLRALEVQASMRHDSYATHAASPNYIEVESRDGPLPEIEHITNRVSDASYTLGLRYSPGEDVTLRASIGTGFLPPGLDQILPFMDLEDLFFNDPKRNGEATELEGAPVISGGNPNLNPEDSRSVSVGVILTPHVLPNLRLSLDYTRIRKTNEISDLDIRLLLDLEDRFPGRVTRAALDPADAARGYTGGVIEGFDLTAVNFASSRVEAYDLRADYGIDAGNGRFDFYAAATQQRHLERKTSPNDTAIDYVGFSGGPLEWRGNAGMTWQRSAWTVGWNAQFFDSYKVYTATATPVGITNAVRNQGDDTIPSQLYHDVFATYRFADTAGFAGRFLDNAQLSVGIQNVFDRDPPILAITGTTGGYSTYGDSRLRRYSISLRKSF